MSVDDAPRYGDVRDELGRIDGCICEPARRGTYSGTIEPECPHHGELAHL